jgi:polyisoprenoid-binding protein YceI
MSIGQKTLAALVISAALAAPARSEQQVLGLDPATSTVSFTLPATGHTVEGRLGVKSGRIEFDPATGAASGQIVIDLKTAATGNESRDKNMHGEVLESAKYPLAVFRAEKLRGAVAPSGSSQVTLDGTLSFHGADHKMSLPAQVSVKNGRVEAEAQFDVPFVAWGLRDPSVLFLRVAKVVAVKVRAVGTLDNAGRAARGTS